MIEPPQTQIHSLSEESAATVSQPWIPSRNYESMLPTPHHQPTEMASFL
jgi:hypothetical protein